MGKLKCRDTRQLPGITQQLSGDTGLPDPEVMLFNHSPDLPSKNYGRPKERSRTFSIYIDTYV